MLNILPIKAWAPYSPPIYFLWLRIYDSREIINYTIIALATVAFAVVLSLSLLALSKSIHKKKSQTVNTMRWFLWTFIGTAVLLFIVIEIAHALPYRYFPHIPMILPT
jgi:multisubunit Na+/H+ antiporter MnhB subunit